MDRTKKMTCRDIKACKAIEMLVLPAGSTNVDDNGMGHFLSARCLLKLSVTLLIIKLCTKRCNNLHIALSLFLIIISFNKVKLKLHKLKICAKT